jgi:hypothetical protein
MRRYDSAWGFKVTGKIVEDVKRWADKRQRTPAQHLRPFVDFFGGIPAC